MVFKNLDMGSDNSDRSGDMMDIDDSS